METIIAFFQALIPFLLHVLTLLIQLVISILSLFVVLARLILNALNLG
jgi:hypothetical protein